MTHAILGAPTKYQFLKQVTQDMTYSFHKMQNWYYLDLYVHIIHEFINVKFNSLRPSDA